MRTTLDIDDALLDALMSRYPGQSKTDAIESAIAAHLSEDAAEWLRSQAGTVDFDEAGWREGRASERSRADERWRSPAP
jgi:Arc/MetJ family transcription regulator